MQRRLEVCSTSLIVLRRRSSLPPSLTNSEGRRCQLTRSIHKTRVGVPSCSGTACSLTIASMSAICRVQRSTRSRSPTPCSRMTAPVEALPRRVSVRRWAPSRTMAVSRAPTRFSRFPPQSILSQLPSALITPAIPSARTSVHARGHHPRAEPATPGVSKSNRRSRPVHPRRPPRQPPRRHQRRHRRLR